VDRARIFLLTRGLTLTARPIFNDEAIYLQYSQRIREDWEKNRFISMNGEFADWKPPLQYWLVSPFIKWGNDPLMVGRSPTLVYTRSVFPTYASPSLPARFSIETRLET